MENTETYKRLFELIKGSSRVCAFTGAGISTLSGMQTYLQLQGLVINRIVKPLIGVWKVEYAMSVYILRNRFV